MPAWFISDLHLDAAEPETVEVLLAFLKRRSRGEGSLYVLGDLFDAWIGDDDDEPLGAAIADAFAALADHGSKLYFIAGNRDFLIGSAFAARAGIELLDDETVHDIDGVATLLLHGDTLCTGDTAYQAFRTESRGAAWRRAFLVQPLEARRAFARRARAESRKATAAKSLEIMDVDPAAVRAAFARHRVTRMIHGHTHRPAVHRIALDDGRDGERIVLADWAAGVGAALEIDGATLDWHRLSA